MLPTYTACITTAVKLCSSLNKKAVILNNVYNGNKINLATLSGIYGCIYSVILKIIRFRIPILTDIQHRRWSVCCFGNLGPLPTDDNDIKMVIV